jgi:hypothetical protein
LNVVQFYVYLLLSLLLLKIYLSSCAAHGDATDSISLSNERHHKRRKIYIL